MYDICMISCGIIDPCTGANMRPYNSNLAQDKDLCGPSKGGFLNNRVFRKPPLLGPPLSLPEQPLVKGETLVRTPDLDASHSWLGSHYRGVQSEGGAVDWGSII